MPSSYKNLAEVFQGGATTSQHVEAKDDDHFENTTFRLKRTRSLGLLDDFIAPTQKLIDEDFVSDETVKKINKSVSDANLTAAQPNDGNNDNVNNYTPILINEIKR
ncbi:hypothetical protein PACTADRAFT_185258 [Pachysolen tannophilus NRRL Y-2460]|uniref:Uncharacterized protein n=1 Tax=Pachysolen tannophilus NRRL Y-2460 TaxID=669874 RepID=A0A1E4U2P0_PACTA|nr:hypothetical protein PACTADRAFT_185258 [Pachysolen tannophilus NRRL Y-2460]